MKKIVFLLALLYGATLMAQNKAVAVTEVVDKEDKVSYATKIMVRTQLTAAISMKQGYTAYDRVDLQSIMSEQNFQRTGLVDDATIKRLGEMTGASLILIPEVAMSDDGKIYVAVKMLDVTTAQTLMSTGELMGNSSEEVEEGCRALTAKVLGVKSVTSSTTATSDKPVTLFGYIHVFPTDIGEFQTLPTQLLSAINKIATYGYDSWRLPTTEELSIMRANSHLIPNFKNTDYLCSDSSTGGLVRLVTTELQATVRDSLRKKSILNLLNLEVNVNWHFWENERIIYRVMGYFEFAERYVIGNSSGIMPGELVLKIPELEKKVGYDYVCCHIDFVERLPADRRILHIQGSGYTKFKRPVYGLELHKPISMEFGKWWKQEINYDVAVILYYYYPLEEEIIQEMQKYY